MKGVYEIVKGPSDLVGKRIFIQGTTEECMQIADPWNHPKACYFPPLLKYMQADPPFSGKIYYGKITTEPDPTPVGYCVHESWLADHPYPPAD